MVLGLVKIDPRVSVSSRRRHETPKRPAEVAGARQVFRPGAALQSEGEAFIVVPGLPAPQGGGRRLEVREALPAPELLLIDPMAPFDLAVLLRPAGSDIPVADPGGFDPQHKGEGELLAVITLQALDGEREGRSELGQEGEARAVM